MRILGTDTELQVSVPRILIWRSLDSFSRAALSQKGEGIFTIIARDEIGRPKNSPGPGRQVDRFREWARVSGAVRIRYFHRRFHVTVRKIFPEDHRSGVAAVRCRSNPNSCQNPNTN